jgi:transposase
VRRNLFWLSDEQWKRIEPHLPRDVRGVERVDDRRVISGINAPDRPQVTQRL